MISEKKKKQALKRILPGGIITAAMPRNNQNLNREGNFMITIPFLQRLRFDYFQMKKAGFRDLELLYQSYSITRRYKIEQNKFLFFR